MLKSAIFFAFCLPCWGTISKIQMTLSNTNCGSGTGTSCAITITTPAVGNAGYFCAALATSGGTVTVPNTSPTSGTWAADVAFTNAKGDIYCWHNLSIVAGGGTSISTTLGTSGKGRYAFYWEIHSTFTDILWGFEATPTPLATGSACTNCPGVAISITGTNDGIIQMIRQVTTVTALSGQSDFLADGSGQTAIADTLNTTTGTAPTWTNVATGNQEQWGAAFTEAHSSSCTATLALMGAGCK